MQANTDGIPDVETGIPPGVYARAKMCKVSQKTGYSICGYGMTPPMVVSGITETPFDSNGMATFDRLNASSRKDDAAILILEVVSPFDGTVVEHRCPPIRIRESASAILRFLTEPHFSGDAGLVLTVQPILESLD